MNKIIIDPHYCTREEHEDLIAYLDEQRWDWKEIKEEQKTREVFYCPICGWESFDPDQYEAPCGQTDCTGKLSLTRKEPYDE